MHSRTPRHSDLSGGFTLVETMFAIVIMGIALAMIAGVIPVGLQLSESSIGTVEAKVGTRNAVTFARSMLTRNDLSAVGTQFSEVDVDSLLETDVYVDAGTYETTKLTHPLAMKEDGTPVMDERKGFKLLARLMDSGPDPRNDYLLAFFFYRENENFTPDNTDEDLNEMAMKKAQIDSLAGDKRSIELSNSGLAKYFQPGSIVVGQNGSWARVSSIDAGTIALSGALAGTKAEIEPVWTIYEHDGDQDSPLPVMSPGLTLLSVRTALRNVP
jgi:prepilin-type N-terminal cleavage/methylation domain-containing protein